MNSSGFFLCNPVITTRIFYSQLLEHGQCLPSDWHRNFPRFTEGVTLPGAPTEMAIGLFIISCLISVTVVCVWHSPAWRRRDIPHPLFHRTWSLVVWFYVYQQSFLALGTWRRSYSYHGGQEAETESWGPGITSEVYLWRPLSPKDILSSNVSRISPHGDEMSSHMSLWGHTSFSNHRKVQSMSVPIGQGELTCSPWPLKTNKSVLLQIFIVGLAYLKFLIRHSHSPLIFLGIYQISIPFSF